MGRRRPPFRVSEFFLSNRTHRRDRRRMKEVLPASIIENAADDVVLLTSIFPLSRRRRRRTDVTSLIGDYCAWAK